MCHKIIMKRATRSAVRTGGASVAVFVDPVEIAPEKKVAGRKKVMPAPEANGNKVFDENSINAGNVGNASNMDSVGKRRFVGESPTKCNNKGEVDLVVKKPKMEISHEEKTMNGAPEGDLFDIKVLMDAELTPLELADNSIIGDHLRSLLASSSQESSSWADKYAAVELIRRVVLFHSSLLQADAVMLTASLEVAVQALVSLRSCSVRNGILCLKAMVTCLPAACMLDESSHVTTLFEALMNRSATGPRFVCESAAEAASTAASRMTPHALIASLHSSTLHRNAEVSSFAHTLIAQSVLRVSAAEVAALDDTLWGIVVSALGRGLDAKRPTGREASRSALLFMHAALGEARFDPLAATALAPSQLAELALHFKREAAAVVVVATANESAVGAEILCATPYTMPASSSSSSAKSKPLGTGPRISIREQMLLQRAKAQEQQQQSAPAPAAAPAPAPVPAPVPGPGPAAVTLSGGVFQFGPAIAISVDPVTREGEPADVSDPNCAATR